MFKPDRKWDKKRGENVGGKVKLYLAAPSFPLALRRRLGDLPPSPPSLPPFPHLPLIPEEVVGWRLGGGGGYGC